MEQQKIDSLLTKVYSILKFGPEEIKNSLNELAMIQQIAISGELAQCLTKEEAEELGGLASKSDEEKRAATERIAKFHARDENFKNAAQAAAK